MIFFRTSVAAGVFTHAKMQERQDKKAKTKVHLSEQGAPRGVELNHRHRDFQSRALPTELP